MMTGAGRRHEGGFDFGAKISCYGDEEGNEKGKGEREKGLIMKRMEGCHEGARSER